MGASCCDDKNLTLNTAPFRRALIAVIVINFAMFLVEMAAGYKAHSKALQADALDFIGDAITYGLSFWVLNKHATTRAKAALFKGISLLVLGAWVLGNSLYGAFTQIVPEAPVMGVVGFMALCANVLSVVILYRFKEGDANIQSVWLCSRNDAISNVVVMVAALGVFGTGSYWPDLITAAIMSGLFVQSAVKIMRQSWRELKHQHPEN